MTHADLIRRTGGSPPDPAVVAAVQRIVEGLPPDLRPIAERLMAGRRARREADLGMSRRQFGKAVAAIRRRLVDAGLRDVF